MDTSIKKEGSITYSINGRTSSLEASSLLPDKTEVPDIGMLDMTKKSHTITYTAETADGIFCFVLEVDYVGDLAFIESVKKETPESVSVIRDDIRFFIG